MVDSNTKIVTIGDSLEGPTGFATHRRGVDWSLAKDYQVYSLGLQTIKERDFKINMYGDERVVRELPNWPRTNQKYDFGTKSLPFILDKLKPDVLITVNDIQMIQHIPEILCPNKINMKVMDLPAKKMLSDEALKRQLEGEVMKFKEKYPRDMKWLAACPEDGHPGMPNWGYIYKMADQCIAFCKYGQQVFKDCWNMDVPYIYHGIETDVFYPKEKPKQLENLFIIGDMNRNQPRKQPVRVMEAFSKFAKGKNDVILHMQMDWNDEFGWPIGYLSQVYGIQNKMMKPQQVGMSREKVNDCYNAWDVCGSAQAGEGFGLVFAESMATSTPPVATDYTTLRELLIEGDPSPRGQVVDYSTLFWDQLSVAAVQRALVDTNKLAEAFELYYNDRELMAKHGENGHEWVNKNLPWTKIQTDWQNQVKDILK